MSDNGTISLLEPHLVGNTLAYLEECITTNFVSSVGPFVQRFAEDFASFVGARFAVPCASGTAALHVALRLLGLSPGDEVMVSTLTFVASGNPILYERATPVLVDSEEETWNLDPALVVEELERRARAGRRQPKALIVVHVLGQPARLDPIFEACERHGVVVIEDAAEALGASYRTGRHALRQVGAIGRMGCYSFNGNKVITTGGGGMLTTDDEQLARRAHHLVTQARLPGAEYRHDEVGFNYRLTNLAAALGLAQLEQLPNFLARKREIAARYDEAFGSRDGIRCPSNPDWSSPSHWLYSVRIESDTLGTNRTEVHHRLSDQGIQTRPIWTPLHLLPMYRDAPRIGGRVAERLFGEALSLPSSVQLTSTEQDRVIDAVLRAVRFGRG